MRSLIIATVLLAAVAQGFVDFNAMSSEHSKSVHPVTGNIHYEHDVHHEFPHPDVSQPPTYFKAKYAAEHEPHWNIIQLHEHIEDMTGVSCGKGKDGEVDRLRIVKPSKELLEKVHSQKKAGYSHTIITAAARHQCHGKGVFRRLTTVEERADGSVVLVVKATSYNQVFKNLDLHIETTHVHQNGKSVASGDWASLPSLAVNQKKTKVAVTAKHGMSIQSIWGDVSSACSDTVADASSVCSDAADAVGDAADTAGDDLKAASDGVMSEMTSFNVDHTFQFKGFNYNGDVTKGYSQDDAATENANMASSFSFTPSVTLKLVIKDFDLSNFETYFTGSATMGITGTFDAKVNKVWTNRKLVTTLYVDAITFSIGPVPVWLTPTVPLYAGFTATVDGAVNIKAVLSGSGSLSLGYGYAPSTGHRLINTHSLKFSHDFGPLTYSADLGIQAYVEPVLACTVESMANVMIGMTIQGDATVQSNGDCALSLNFAAQPTVALNADIDASLMGHSIYQKKFGPWTLYSTKIPLYSYCKPQSAAAKSLMGQHSGSGLLSRKMASQSATHVITTVEKHVTPRHIGKTWSGASSSLQANTMVDMQYGAQFSVGPRVNSTRLFMTLVKTQKSPHQEKSHNGLLSAVASMVYEADQLPVGGQPMIFNLIQMTNVSYVAASNSSVLKIVPSPTMKWTVDAENIRFVQMESDMTYGTVSFVSPKSDNSTASFTIFRSGGGVKIAGLDVDKTDLLSLMIYACAATVVMLVSIVVAVVFHRKFRAVRRTAVIAQAKETTTGLIQGSEQADEVALEINGSV